MSFEILPDTDDFPPRAFSATARQVNKIAAALGLYILLVIYPGYGLVRLIWANDATAFDLEGFSIAIVTSICFGLYARKTIRSYLAIR